MVRAREKNKTDAGQERACVSLSSSSRNSDSIKEKLVFSFISLNALHICLSFPPQ